MTTIEKNPISIYNNKAEVSVEVIEKDTKTLIVLLFKGLAKEGTQKTYITTNSELGGYRSLIPTTPEATHRETLVFEKGHVPATIYFKDGRGHTKTELTINQPTISEEDVWSMIAEDDIDGAVETLARLKRAGQVVDENLRNFVVAHYILSHHRADLKAIPNVIDAYVTEATGEFYIAVSFPENSQVELPLVLGPVKVIPTPTQTISQFRQQLVQPTPIDLPVATQLAAGD